MADKIGPRTIDEYIAGYPIAVQNILQKLRVTISRATPDAVETINYQIPTFMQNGNLVHFAAHKNHISFFPAPSGIQAFKNELSVYEGAKGSIKFPLDKPLPFLVISRIVKYSVKENLKKKPKKKN